MKEVKEIFKIGDEIVLHGTILDLSVVKIENISGMQFFEAETADNNLYIGFTFPNTKKAKKIAKEIEKNEEEFPEIIINGVNKGKKIYPTMFIFVYGVDYKEHADEAREEVKKAIKVFADKIN